MGTHPIFESDFDCLTELYREKTRSETSKKVARGKSPWIWPMTLIRIEKHLRLRTTKFKNIQKKWPVTSPYPDCMTNHCHGIATDLSRIMRSPKTRMNMNM